MLLEDKVEKLARAIAEFLAHTRLPHGSVWRDPPYRAHEDLRPLKRTVDDEVSFVRTRGDRGWQARLQLSSIRELEPDPASIVIHPEIVLDSKPRYGATVVIDAYESSSPSGGKDFEVELLDGETELEAVNHAFRTEAWATTKASAEAGVEVGPASAKASVETEVGFRTSLESAWNRQTGRTRETRVRFRSTEYAPAWTRLEQRLQWTEQTKQRRIECVARIDCRVVIGRRGTHKGKWGWASGSPVVWESVEHLLAVAQRRGSVHHAGYEYFAKDELSPDALAALARIDEARKIKVDRLTPAYPGNADIRIQLVDAAVNPAGATD